MLSRRGRHNLDEVFLRGRTLPAAAAARIDEGMETCPSGETGTAGGHLAHELRKGTLRQGIGLDFVVQREIGDFWGIDEGPANDAPQQTFMGKAIYPVRSPVAQADRVD